MDKTLSLSKWEAMFTYKNAVKTIPYIKVLTKQEKPNKYAERELKDLVRYKNRLRKYLHEVHEYSYSYLDNVENL